MTASDILVVNGVTYSAKESRGNRMNKIGSYGVYQNSIYNRETNVVKKSLTEKKAEEAKKTEKADKTDSKKNVQLSEKAKALLEELKKTYTNMDFYVADYETDEEADRYLSGLSGTKEYNVLIDVETLEAMAEDSEVRAQYENLMQDSVKQLEGMLEDLGPDREQVTRVGISIRQDGTVSYFAELDKLRAGQKERIEQVREKKEEEAKKAEATDADEKKETSQSRRYKVEADSVEELLDKIKSAAARDRWQMRLSEQEKPVGGQVDYTV